MNGPVLFNGDELAVGTPSRSDKACLRVKGQNCLIGRELNDLHIEFAPSLLLVCLDQKASVRSALLVCLIDKTAVVFGGEQRDGCKKNQEYFCNFHKDQRLGHPRRRWKPEFKLERYTPLDEALLLAILFGVVLDVIQDSKMDAMDDLIGNHTPVELR
jgi:hypothetical protein